MAPHQGKYIRPLLSITREQTEKLCKEVDIIIPLAAIVGFPACAADPQLAKEINFNQIFNISKLFAIYTLRPIKSSSFQRWFWEIDIHIINQVAVYHIYIFLVKN